MSARGKATFEMQELEQSVEESRTARREAATALSGATDLNPEHVRVETYALLAALLRQAPDSDLLAAIARTCLSDVPSVRPTALELGWQALGQAARSADPGLLETEFHTLFVGLGRGELLPYGSWYISGFLMDKPLALLRDELARLGLARAEGVLESEDHAAAICETMALLADPDDGIRLADQKKFFSTYAGGWLPRFFKDLQGAKNADFYVSVGQLGEAFIEFDKVWLDLPE